MITKSILLIRSTRVLGVQELLGDECLDFFMPVETTFPNQVSNNISIQKGNNGTMQKLQSYSELVDTLKNDRKFCEFHGPTDEWLIDQGSREYFDKTYDDRGILFAWCEITKEMDILGINKMEGLANYLYHPEKVCAIMEDTGELVPRVELKCRVKEEMAKEKLEKERKKSWQRKKGWQSKSD